MTVSQTITPRQTVINTDPDSHGALNFEELERLNLDPDDVLDFSVNSNPYGPSPAVRQAMAQVAVERYPDREALALRRILAERLSISVEQLVIGNGTVELLWFLAFAFLQRGERALVVGPTFGEYERCAALMGACVHKVIARAENAFVVDRVQVAQALEESKPKLAFICNPNNPTGTSLDLEVIDAWVQDHPHTLFVIDEAYLSFVLGSLSALSLERPNVLVLRSMTKEYAIAGLRLGYAAGPVAVIEALARVRPAWNVNSVAQAAGGAALQDKSHLESSLTNLAAAKAALLTRLEQLDLHPVPSQTHFFIVEVGNGAAFRQALMAHKIQVRDCASFDLPAYVRIATRLPHENASLLAAIEAVQQ